MATPEFRDEFLDSYLEIEKNQTELADLSNHKSATDGSLSEIAKSSAANAIQVAKSSKLSLTLRSQITQLGKAIYERHLENSGPDELVTPIRDTLSQINAIDEESNILSGGASGYLKRVPTGWLHNPWVVGGSLIFCFPIGLVLLWTKAEWPTKTKWIITGVGCLLALGLFSSKDKGGSASNGDPQTVVSSTEKKSKGGTTGEYELKETFQLGGYKYSILNASSRFEIGNQFIHERPSAGAVFLIVTYTIENATNKSQTVMSDDFKLIDSQGRIFSPSSKANTALVMSSDNKDFILSELQPGIPRNMQQAFEVPQATLNAPVTLVIPEKGWFSSGEAKVRIKF